MEPVLLVVILIFSVILHEISHGYAAEWLGDPTARLEGRLTLNPIPHIDPIGSVVLPGLLALTSPFVFGWAKPVPYNPYNLSNRRWGEAFVAGAGPLTNLGIAVLFGLLIRFGAESGFMDPAFLTAATYVVLINIVLGFFNLIPVPPLDGSKVLMSILPYHMQGPFRHFERGMAGAGFFGLVAFLLLFVYVLSVPFSMFVGFIFSLLTGLPF